MVSYVAVTVIYDRRSDVGKLIENATSVNPITVMTAENFQDREIWERREQGRRARSAQGGGVGYGSPAFGLRRFRYVKLLFVKQLGQSRMQ